jgi:hypothetical protein
MAHSRDPVTPFPRDPGVQPVREYLYPYRVVTEDGRTLELAAATLTEFAGIYSWNRGDRPATDIVCAVQNQCWRENDWANRHLIRLLAVGTLGLIPHQVGDAVFWHKGYVAMHDGDPEPEADLDDYYAFWNGDAPEDLGGVCAESGLLCWWEVKLGPGWARETAYFLQEFTDFLEAGPPERVLNIWIDRGVESELRPLVATTQH